MQNGGLLIVSAGGEKVIFSYKQKSPGDHVANDEILKALGIEAASKNTGTDEVGATGGNSN